MDAGITLFNLPDLAQQDFRDARAHNRRAAALWAAFREGRHERVPVRFNTNPRMLLLDDAYNKCGMSYEEYMHDPEVMAQVVLEWQYWCRFLLPGDHEKGLPAQWPVHVDFQNLYEAAWFGCPVHYRDGQVPDTTPILNDDNKRMLFDAGIPDPFAGAWTERWFHFINTWDKKRLRGWTFLGIPVTPVKTSPFAGTDGIFTVAASLRGPTELCRDLLEDPDYARELLEYVYEATAERMRSWRDRLEIPMPQDSFMTADDAIELLSVEQYREFVLPLHKRLYGEFATAESRSIHLCGHVQRLLPVVRQELGVTVYDTGYPLDFAELRRQLGTESTIYGGPRVQLFVGDSREELVAEAERILASGVLEGGRFVLQEGNNLPPRTPLDHCQAVYDTAERAGRREGRW